MRPEPPDTRLERREHHGGEPLGALLKRCRARIGPEHSSLGSYLRLPIRVGKAVTQEEVAEAAGISRQWYALLENDRPVRVSATVLARIADSLMMDPTERATLFRLAVPELRTASLTDRSTAVVEAFGALRRLTRRLWTATTTAERAALIREHAMTTLAPDAVVTCINVGKGLWDHAACGEDDECGSRFHAVIRQRWGDGAIDDLHRYDALARPGEIMLRSDGDSRPHVSYAAAHIRSQRGLFGRLSLVHFTAREFSDTERAQLSTLAELASLALRDM
jgi:transcriptional regulator with XRE-family HTH domain